MWELVTRLLWLPFDIMQRISQRFLQLGRSVYGSLIAPSAKPAIKPTPPPAASASPPPSNLFSAPFPVAVLPGRNISTSTSSSSSTIPSCVTIDMESAEATNDEATKRTFPTTNYEQSSISTSISASADTEASSLSSATTVDQQRVPSSFILEAAAASELNPPAERDLESPSLSAITKIDSLALSSSSNKDCCDVLVSGIAAAAAVDSSTVSIGPEEPTFVADEPQVPTFKVVVADEQPEIAQVASVKMNSEACVVVEGDDKGEWPTTTNPTCTALVVDTPPSVVRPDKRFREKEKRRQVNKQNNIVSEIATTKANAEANDSQSSSEAKKPKLSEECEQPSTSSTCQDSTANNKDISSQVKKSKKRRSKKSKKGLEDQKESVEGGDKMGVVERAPPPNFFIAIQIANKEIVSNVAQLQKSLTERNLSQSWHGLSSTDVFRDAMVPVAKLHFTLHVMHLKGEEDLIKAQNALTECCSEVHQEFLENPMDLTIEGLGHFRNNVIFAQIKERMHIDRLTKLSEIFRKKFKELNIPVDPRPFNPHMTIAKISRSNKLYKKKIRAFPTEMWSGCEQTSFGKQRVTGLQLLQMAGEDKTTGYYQCFGQHYFEDPLRITPAACEWQNKKLKDDEDNKDKISD